MFQHKLNSKGYLKTYNEFIFQMFVIGNLLSKSYENLSNLKERVLCLNIAVLLRYYQSSSKIVLTSALHLLTQVVA